jgi:hypothetical protein
MLKLSAPTQITFFVSVVLAIVALVFRFSGLEIPAVINHPFGALLLGYLVLVAGNVLTDV